MLIKKKLLELTVHPYPKKLPPAKGRVDYFYDAEISGDILHLTLFDPENERAVFKVFCNQTNHINYDLQRKKWSHSSLDNLGSPRFEYWRRNVLCPVTPQAESAGACFFEGYDATSTSEAISRSQYRQKSEANATKSKAKKKETDAIFANWPELPEGWQKRLEDGLWNSSKYCFFRKTKKDDLSQLDVLMNKEFGGVVPPYIGECSDCGKSFSLDERPEHDNETYGNSRRFDVGKRLQCPHCHSLLAPKMAHLGRKNLMATEWYAVAMERDGIIYVDVLDCWRKYDAAPYCTHYDSRYRYLFDTVNNKTAMWSYHFHYGWQKNKNFREPPNLIYYLDDSVVHAIEYNRLQYCRDRLDDTPCLLKSMHIITQYPCVEILDRIGMKQFVDELERGTAYTTMALNLKGKNLREITKLTKPQREFAAKNCHTGFELLIYQMLCKENHPGAEEDMKLLRSWTYERNVLLDMVKAAGARRALNYIQKQIAGNPKDTINDVLTFWKDYCEECRKLDYDLTDRYTLLPPDLRKAHAKTSALVTEKNNKASNDKITKRLPKLERKYCFENEHYFIRPAQSAGELVAEGKMLHHCVGTYIERYAKGETDILFVRRKEAPEEPFVTVEIRGNAIKQAYGKGNSRPPREVQDFLDIFLKQLSKKKNAA